MSLIGRIEKLERTGGRKVALLVSWELEPDTQAVTCGGKTFTRLAGENLTSLFERVGKTLAPLPGQVLWIAAA